MDSLRRAIRKIIEEDGQFDLSPDYQYQASYHIEWPDFFDPMFNKSIKKYPVTIGTSRNQAMYENETVIDNKKVFNPSKYASFKNLTEEDLRDIARWGLTGEFEYSGAWDDTDNNIEKAINNIIEDFKWELKTYLPTGFYNFPNEIIAYRLISLKNIQSLNRSHLGLSWFLDKEVLDDDLGFIDQLPHLRSGQAEREGNEVYLITAKIPQSKVDIPRSLFQRSLNSAENELVLKDDSNIKVISLDKI